MTQELISQDMIAKAIVLIAAVLMTKRFFDNTGLGSWLMTCFFKAKSVKKIKSSSACGGCSHCPS